MRVGVVSDIHGNFEGLRLAVERMGRIDRLLFTGDGYRDISRLREETNLIVEGVAGNCDLFTEYPAELVTYIEQYKVLLTHGHLYGVKNGLTRIGLAGRAQEVSLIVFGHTHLPLSDIWYEVGLFNPGTLSRDRGGKAPSYGIIETTPQGLAWHHERL